MTNLPTDIDEIKRVLIIFAAEIYKLAGAGNGNFEGPYVEAAQAIALEINKARIDELKRMSNIFGIGGDGNEHVATLRTQWAKRNTELHKLQGGNTND